MTTIWNKEGTLTLMDGQAYNLDQLAEKFPFVKSAVVVIETSRDGMVMAIDSLGILCQVYDVDDSLTDQEAFADIQAKKSAEKEATKTAVSDEKAWREDIKSLLAYQAMMLE